ncbi:MAG: cupin domain-containing protein [Rhodobacteraceae bacterium]|nr:cupin domain-containing protein [Paracoccaceae bacterium]
MSVNAVEVGQRAWETWRPGVRSRSWSGEIDGARQIRVGEQIFEPGSIGVPPHWHYYEEHILLLSGKMRIDVAGTTRELEAPACVIIPAGAVHSFSCIGNTPMHILGALGAPIHESFFVDMDENEAVREYEADYPGGARRRVRVDPVTRQVEHLGEIQAPASSPA